MTSKEQLAKKKVRAVWPDACEVQLRRGKWLIAHGNDPERPGYSILGSEFSSIEAAWQNAAESLPDQPEQDLPIDKQCVCWGTKGCEICGGSGELPTEPMKIEGEHRFMAGTCIDCGKPLAETCIPFPPMRKQEVVYDAWGKAGRLQPVAPVEAKEKERRYPTGGDPKDFCVCGHHEMCHANYADMSRVCNQTGCGCRNYQLEVAEPKPTPSENECEEQECEGAIPAKCPRCGHPIWGEGWNPTTGVRYFSHAPKPQPDSSSIPDETDPCKMPDARYEEYIYGPNRAQWPTNRTEVAEEDAFQAIENHLFSYKGNCDCRFHKAIKNNTIYTSPGAELAKADDCLHGLMENQASTVKDKATAAHVLVHDLAAILSNNSEIRDSYKPPDGQIFEEWWATDPVWTMPSSLARLAWNAAKGQR